MERTRRHVLIAVGAGSLLAGCLGDDDADDAAGADDDGPAATVGLSTHSQFGDILVGRNRLTLYMFDADEQHSGESACYDGCVDNWPPLVVDSEPTAGAGVEAELTTFERDDGETQVAANGWPLYYWVGDGAEGDLNGHGVEDIWWILGPDGVEIREALEEEEPSPGGGGGY